MLKDYRLDGCIGEDPKDLNLDFIPLVEGSVVVWLSKDHSLARGRPSLWKC